MTYENLQPFAQRPTRSPRTVLSAFTETTVPRQPEMVTDWVVAELLGVKRGTVAKWRERGVGPVYHKHGKAVRYALADVLAFRLQHRVEPRDV